MPDAPTTISANDLKDALEGEHPPVLINALPREAHVAKHIPGSVNVPVDEIERVETIVPNKDALVVVYCANADCTASLKAAQALEETGYTNVVDFENGYAGWRRAGHPLVGKEN
ncbi:rhodanese-like domain-containing protein [Salinibacter altiplanensis]|uniref:rhodanese-like domain-containing protein n=1 Tax=Salinibacter altiplanensis TaxID=1803181 RepID=UPI000C9FA52A|nr:rhodanese-like domain-containing protein [Salinibacter altiplanensis]